MGTLNISLEPVNALNIVREIVDDMTLKPLRRTVFYTRITNSIPSISVDSERLRQILFNLIGMRSNTTLREVTVKIASTK
jgi:signal transduction histidine kinase